MSCAVLQVSAEDTDDITLTSDETILSEAPLDTLQTSEDNDISIGALEEGDADEVLTSDAKSFQDIRDLIDSARAGSTVYLEGTYMGDGSPITIAKRITIEGRNGVACLDADGNSRIFEISASNVVLKNILFKNGYVSDDNGGAIYFNNGNHNLDNCYFEENTASRGGAIYNYGAAVTVSNSKFNDNYARDDGGAVFNYGNSMSLTNCRFENNKATDDGGAIYDDADSLTARNCYFGYNTANYWGGAMNGGTAYESQFVGNYAARGGAMYYGSEFDCTFSSNSPQNVYGTDCYESIVGAIQLSKSGGYYGGTSVSAKVINSKRNNALSDVPVTFKFSNGKSATVYTNSNGVATYNVPFNPGTYSVTASIPSSYGGASASLGGVKIAKASAKIVPSKLKTKYQAGKYFKVKVVNTKTKKGISGVKLLLKVYTGKKAKKVHVTTDASGFAYYSAAKLKVGNHKVKVSIATKAVKAKAKNSKISVKKASTALNTYDALYYYKDVKKGQYYIGVYNKDSGQYLKGIKLKVKVFTGKKSKIYTVKTKKDGFAILKTKGIKVGKHKVQITFKGNKNFKKVTAKNTIEVTKKMPTRVGYHVMLTSYFNYGGSTRSISPYVKDMYGNELSHKKITIYGSNGGSNTGYTGEYIRLPSGSTVVIKFAGDSKYMPSQFTINFV